MLDRSLSFPGPSSPNIGIVSSQTAHPLAMPNVSEREKVLNDIEQAMKLVAYDAVLRDDSDDSELDEPLFPPGEGFFSSDDEDESSWGTLCKLHCLISQKRFLEPRHNLGKSRDFVENYFLDLPEDQFRKITRVTRDTFLHIVHLIEFDLEFHNVSTCEQAPVHWQLAVGLDRLGNDGQGVSHARSKHLWGIGQGTIHLYTHRVVQALFHLRNQFIKWPTEAERLQISKWMEQKGFKHLVGFVDGTCIPLHQKPAIYGNVFLDRKKRYSVNAQVICDDRRRIVFFMTGDPGSVHDARVFGKSIIAQRSDMCFSANQFLLADSAYAATPTVVPSYKENQQDCRTDQDEPRRIKIFNTMLAKGRVVNEHMIGILKACWSSMRGMRVNIHERDDMETFIRQAYACVVLHNISLTNDPWEEEYSDESDDENADGQLGVRQRRILTPG